MSVMMNQNIMLLPAWENDFQCFRYNINNNKKKGIQVDPNVEDAIVYSPPKATRSDRSNTTDETDKCDICKCSDKKIKTRNRNSKSWESLAELYGDVDTTKVWNEILQKPNSLYTSNKNSFYTSNKNSLYTSNRYEITEQPITYQYANFVKNEVENNLDKRMKQKEKLAKHKKGLHNNSNAHIFEPNLEVPIDEKYLSKMGNKTKVKSNKSEKKAKRNEKHSKSKYITFKLEKKPKLNVEPNLNQYTNRHFCTTKTCKEALDPLRGFQIPSTEISKAVKTLKPDKKNENKRTMQGDFCDKSSCKHILDRFRKSHKFLPIQSYNLNTNDLKCTCKNIVNKTTAKEISDNDKIIKENLCMCKANSKDNNWVVGKFNLITNDLKCTCKNIANKSNTKEISDKHETVEENFCKCKITHKDKDLIVGKFNLSPNNLKCTCKNISNKTTAKKIDDNNKIAKGNFCTCEFKHKDTDRGFENFNLTHNNLKCTCENISNKIAVNDITDNNKIVKENVCTCKIKHRNTNRVDGKFNLSPNYMKCTCKYIANKITTKEINEKDKIVKENITEHKDTKQAEKCNCRILKKTLSYFADKKSKDGKDKRTKSDKVSKKAELPLLEIKVDSSDMHVINQMEIRDQVKTLGKPLKRRECVCPSHKKYLKKHVCEAGICEMARQQKGGPVICSCVTRDNTVECNDMTCNRKRRRKKNEVDTTKPLNSDKSKDKTNPLFEVVIDESNMSLMNSKEIVDIFRKASKHKVCPEGICRKTSLRSNWPIRCKCIKKKIPEAIACSEATCFNAEKRGSKICNFCSRIFSKSDNWTKLARNQKLRHRPRRRHNLKVNSSNKRKLKTKSDTFHKRGGLNIKISREKNWRRRGDERKKQKTRKNPSSLNMFLRKTFCSKCCQTLYKKKEILPADATFEEKFKYCLKENQKHCEENLKRKEKLYKKSEKKIDKEILKELRQIREQRRREGHEWNCLTNFVFGAVNVVLQTTKKIFLTAYNLISDPLGSYVYTREKAKYPIATVLRVLNWISRTWRNKQSSVASAIKQSHFMNVISDQVEDLPIVESIFSNKGQNSEEKAYYERKKKSRKRRIQKRQDEALYGCRHMLLTTLRKTPCLWFYHICPNLYPQCLSLVTFMTNFFHILIYLAAVLCWTPCILTFEMCRAFLCCFLCTH